LSEGVYTEKEELSQILRMLVVLRKSWQAWPMLFVKDRRSTQRRGTGSTKLTTKKKSPGKPGSAKT
jgi:hypothetical protein